MMPEAPPVADRESLYRARSNGVDVEPVPLPGNRAHAEIFGCPPFDTDRLFDRIKQALARIASVALPPDCLDTKR